MSNVLSHNRTTQLVILLVLIATIHEVLCVQSIYDSFYSAFYRRWVFMKDQEIRYIVEAFNC